MTTDKDFIGGFSGETGAEFMENLARTLASVLKFEGHGPLTHEEQIAFVWGFRHGVHQVMSLQESASRDGDKSLSTIMRLLDDARAAWSLGIGVKVMIADLPPSSDTVQ